MRSDTPGRTPTQDFAPETLRRIELTSAVRDTDPIPKVPDAGEVTVRDGSRVQVMHNGVVVEADSYYGAWVTEIIRRLRGHHEPQEEKVFHEIVERLKQDTPAPTMLELGSYWAYYSLWLKHAHPDARCILVEPDPANLAVGRRNFVLNGMDGRFIEAAAGSNHGAKLRLRAESGGTPYKVRAISVDGLMADECIDRVDILLCDAQGGELEMLRGAREALRLGRVRFLVVSTHMLPSDPALHQRCLAALEGMGAQIVAEHSIPESCSVDGLVVASLDPRDRGWTVDVTIGRARNSVVGELEWQLARTRGWRGFARQVGRPLLRFDRAREMARRVDRVMEATRHGSARNFQLTP